MESNLLSCKVLQAFDVTARQNIKFGIVHLRDVVDPLLDVLNVAGFLKEVENVRMRDRDIDSPEIQKIGDIFRRPVGYRRKDTKVFAIIECLGKFRREADKTSFK